EHVCAGIAGQPVGESVADAGDVGRAGEDEVLDIADHMGRMDQAEGDARLHRIDARPAGLADNVAAAVDDVDVVAGQTAHWVAAEAAVERVAGRGANQQVVEVRADEAVDTGECFGAHAAADRLGAREAEVYADRAGGAREAYRVESAIAGEV